MKPAHKANLLELATILDEVPNYEYDPRYYRTDCGTPSCALGHWAARKRPELIWSVEFIPMHVWAELAYEAFGSWWGLFNSKGCGGAQTAKEAAAYIRDYVEPL